MPQRKNAPKRCLFSGCTKVQLRLNLTCVCTTGRRALPSYFRGPERISKREKKLHNSKGENVSQLTCACGRWSANTTCACAASWIQIEFSYLSSHPFSLLLPPPPPPPTANARTNAYVRHQTPGEFQCRGDEGDKGAAICSLCQAPLCVKMSCTRTCVNGSTVFAKCDCLG